MREEFFNEDTGYSDMCDIGEGYESHSAYLMLQGEIEQELQYIIY